MTGNTTLLRGGAVAPGAVGAVRAGVPVAMAALTLSLVAAAVFGGDGGGEPSNGVRAALAVGFACSGWLLTRSAATRRAGLLVLSGVVVAAVEFSSGVSLGAGDGETVVRMLHGTAGALVLAIAFHVLVSLPDGRLPRRSLRLGTAMVYVASVILGAVLGARDPRPSAWPFVAMGAVWVLAGIVISKRRYARASGSARPRMQWVGLSLAMVAEVALVVGTLHLLLGWPPRPVEVVGASLLLVAGGLAASASPRPVVGVDRVLAHTVPVTGLTLLIVAASLFVLVGLRRVPTVDERPILGLSMAAAALCALLYVPAQTRLTAFANRLVFGESRNPTEALATFGSRMTRALPMDELLLQLAELCKKHYGLRAAEVWTGTGGRLVRTAAVPDVGSGRLALGSEELAVVTRAGLCGRGWAAVWLPTLLEGRGGGPLRIAPMTHSGQLYGLLVLERPEASGEFSEEDGRVLTELARQVGLALRNSELDSALQATLEEVQRKNVELAESRARIVASGDAERRRIERNLHDGAQQHLVALAVKLRLAQRVGETDPAAAMTLVEEARADVLATVEELRALAHGIYPPLLMGFPTPWPPPPGGPRSPPRSRWTPTSGASARRSRPRCTSAASRPSRTRPSTAARRPPPG